MAERGSRRNYRTKCLNCGALEHIYYSQAEFEAEEAECHECGELGALQKLTLPPGALWEDEFDAQ